MSTESVFRLLSTLLLIATLSISINFRRKADSTGEKVSAKGEGKFVLFTRLTLGLSFWFVLFSYMFFPNLIKFAHIDIPTYLRWLGVGMMVVMMPMFYWMFSTLGNNITKTVAIWENHQLITDGPYKYIRHPLYTFGLINFVGFGLASANVLIVALVIVGMIPLILRTPIEEEKLIEKFGDAYMDYINITGRYLPKLRKLN